MLTTKDVAADLGVGLTTVKKWIAEGRLPALKIGNVIRIDEGDYASFKIAARNRQAEPCPTARKDRNTGTSATSTPAGIRLRNLLEPKSTPRPRRSNKSSGPKRTTPASEPAA
jgi:excisionase family DNA binding protein